MNSKRALLLACFVAIGLTACAERSRNERTPTKVEQEMPTTYQVGQLQGGAFTPLGTISFDENHNATLSLMSQGAAAEELRAAWSKIADKDQIRVKRTEESETTGGEMEVRVVGKDVAKSSEEYPQAVIDYLGNTYGYFATPMAVAK
jgi:hypothetical protein